MEISFNTKTQHNSNIQCNNSGKPKWITKDTTLYTEGRRKKEEKIYLKDTLHFKVEISKHNSNIQCNKSMN